jgi:hypothetical protein
VHPHGQASIGLSPPCGTGRRRCRRRHRRYRVATYIVISNPKRMSQNCGVVQAMMRS